MVSIKYSCVMDKAPKFQYQTLVWVQTLIHFGKQNPASILVHAIEGTDKEQIDLLESFGVAVKVVKPFDPRNPYCNKLVQLETRELQQADYTVLCDCDLAFCEDISSFIQGDCVKAKVVDTPKPPLRVWENIFKATGLNQSFPLEPIPPSYEKKRKTYTNNCNGGLYVIPKIQFNKLKTLWPKWCLWLLDNVSLLERFKVHVDQVSFGLAMAELGENVQRLPLIMNYPTHLKFFPRFFYREFNVAPKLTHYHSNLDASGFMNKVGFLKVDQVIDEVNSFLKEERSKTLII